MAKGSNAPKSPHIPNTMRQSLLHNSHFSAEVEKSLADTLKTQNVKSPYEFIDNLSTTLDWKNNNGILESMSNPSNPTPYPVDFNTIKNENFSLQELEKVWQEALISFPPFTTPHGTVHLESVISEIVKNDIATLMQGQEKIDFLAHVGTNSSLSAIIRDVDFFVNTMLPNSKNKKNLKNEINNYRLPFAKIKSRLEARGVDFAQINAGSQFASWPDEQKKLFDAMTSSMLITRMQDRVQQMTDLMRGVD